MTLRVSVVVPTYRRPDLLRRCLDALKKQSLPPEWFEIIVCDDGPDADVQALVEGLRDSLPGVPGVRYLAITGTQGPAAARNRGWRVAQSPVIAFTDDDTIPDADWLEQGLAAMSADVAAACGRVVVPLPVRPTDTQVDAARLESAEFVTANCFVRRDVLDVLGGFDERFSMAWREDSDLHFRLIEGGYQIVQAPAARVVHPLRDMPFGASLGMQKKILFDVLLYAKHPRLYRARIRPGPPWFYLSVSVLLVLAAMLATAGASGAALATLALWVAATGWFFLRRLRNSACTVWNAVELLLTSMLIPPLSIFWRVVGMRRFGVRFP